MCSWTIPEAGLDLKGPMETKWSERVSSSWIFFAFVLWQDGRRPRGGRKSWGQRKGRREGGREGVDLKFSEGATRQFCRFSSSYKTNNSLFRQKRTWTSSFSSCCEAYVTCWSNSFGRLNAQLDRYSCYMSSGCKTKVGLFKCCVTKWITSSSHNHREYAQMFDFYIYMCIYVCSDVKGAHESVTTDASDVSAGMFQDHFRWWVELRNKCTLSSRARFKEALVIF